MTPYALENFEKVKSDKVKYEPLRGVSENLPFEDGSVDVAVVAGFVFVRISWLR